MSEHASPSSTMSVTQQSDAAPAVEQPEPPHWPHSTRQHARPSEDSIPGMPSALVHTDPVGQQQGHKEDRRLSLESSVISLTQKSMYFC